MEGDEEVLTGGNVADVVMRVGDTVRKPATPATPAVEALLEHLNTVGFRGAPRTLGRDEHGRHILEYVPGPTADALPPFDEDDLRRVGELIRSLHDALASFIPPADARWDVLIPADRTDLICHHDLAPWNLVRQPDRWVLIDWDGAGPGSRLWDLGYAAQSFVPLRPGIDPEVAGRRLRCLADAYGLDAEQRVRLPGLIAAHTRGMSDVLRDAVRTGRQPWAGMHDAGHGSVWRAASDYTAEHAGVWAAALTRGS